MIKRFFAGLLFATSAFTLSPMPTAHADDVVAESRIYFPGCFVQGCDASLLVEEVDGVRLGY
ncbi:hypothetical protein [Streptomyces sp. NRRL B-24572]|uniref:hypothetical protein n=1 Tax=Streptomyces sp. NRRL B-24572 TaxID=1962156 RepID=UPI000A3B9506|nr:hypothetical protein [Streptomyces sp. NRRL B-24572]